MSRGHGRQESLLLSVIVREVALTETSPLHVIRAVIVVCGIVVGRNFL